MHFTNLFETEQHKNAGGARLGETAAPASVGRVASARRMWNGHDVGSL